MCIDWRTWCEDFRYFLFYIIRLGSQYELPKRVDYSFYYLTLHNYRYAEKPKTHEIVVLELSFSFYRVFMSHLVSIIMVFIIILVT